MLNKSNFKQNLVPWANHNRIYICLVLVLILMPILILMTEAGGEGVAKFYSSANMVPLLKTSVLYATAGIGFTYVMIGGNFDLSITSVINIGSCLSIGFFNDIWKAMGGAEAGLSGMITAWLIAFAIAIAGGALVGILNGLLVAYLDVHSFIVTIGTQTAGAGFVYTFCNGNSLAAKDASLTNLMETPFHKIGATEFIKASYMDIWIPRVVITLLVIAFFAFLLLKTRWGRDLLMTGSNKEAAWQAGINVRKKILMTFVISGATAAFAGALFAVSMNAAVPNFGERGINPLMLTMASTIIGGTVMTGGSGCVIKTAVAVVVFEMIFSALLVMGMGFDAQVLAAGVLLASIVFYEAFSLYRQGLRKGIRPALLEEVPALKKAQKKA